MNSNSPTKDIFDKALLLEEDEVIILRFGSNGEMASKKTLLHRERTKYEQKFLGSPSFKYIAIVVDRKDSHKGIYRLYLAASKQKGLNKDSWVEDVMISKGGGREVPLFQEEKTPVNESEKERIRRLKELDEALITD